VNISECAEFLCDQDPFPLPANFEAMSDRARQMVRKALDALLDQDPDLAREVLAMDDRVDQLDQSLSLEIQTNLSHDASSAESAVSILHAIRDLERIADLATNVAEDVVFLVEAELIRHGTKTSIE